MNVSKFSTWINCKSALFLAMSVMAGCASNFTSDASTHASATPGAGRVFVYNCGNFSFATQVWPATVVLRLPDRNEPLQRVVSGSGEKYQKDDLVFWSKGEEASLDIGAQRYPQCRIDTERSAQEEDARLRRISLRAAGYDPDWKMEVFEDRWISFSADVRGPKIDVQTPVPSKVGMRTMYRAQSADYRIRVVVERSGCLDVMSGKIFDAKIAVQLNDKPYLGCADFSAWYQ